MQTVTLHEQTNTMKIKVVEQVEKNLTLPNPYFFRDVNRDNFFMITENKLIKVFIIGEHCAISKLPISQYEKEISKGIQVTEQEFTDAYTQATTAIAHSLVKSIPCQK